MKCGGVGGQGESGRFRAKTAVDATRPRVAKVGQGVSERVEARESGRGVLLQKGEWHELEGALVGGGE